MTKHTNRPEVPHAAHSPRPGRRTGVMSLTQPAAQLLLPTDAAFHAVFDTSAEALVVVNSDSLIVRANARARELLNLADSAAERTALGEFLHAPELAGPGSPWAQLFTASRVRTFEAILPTGPSVRFVLRSVMPVTGDLLLCVEQAAVAGRAEVANWSQLEGKLLQTEKMAALGQLVSGIAHELNNPLTAIMGYAQLLLGHGLAPLPLSEAEKVYQQAERARRIVKNLLCFARENKTERVQVDLNEIVERTLALRSYELKVENIAVESDLDPGCLPPWPILISSSRFC